MLDALDLARVHKISRRVRSLVVSRRHQHPLQNPEDVVFGAFPISLTDGHQNTKPGLHFNSLLGRTRVAGAIEAGEIEDPPELIFLRQPGQWPWGPLGQTALLAADAAPGDTTFYVTTRRSLPFAAPAGTIPFVVGKTEAAAGQQISYTDHGAHRATLSGSHPVGSAALLYAAATFIMPSAGLGPIGTEMLEWTGKGVAAATTVAVAAKAGDSTLALASVAGLPASGVIEASGSVDFNVAYTGIVGNVLQGCTGIRRNLPVGAAVTLRRLTGVTHVDYLDLPVIADAALGATRLRLLNTGNYAAWWASLPTAGSARLTLFHSTTVLNVSWTGKDAVAGELTGVTGLTAAVPYMSALTYVNRGVNPTQVVHDNLAVLEIGRVTGAAGFTVGATRGVFAEFLPRTKSPTPKNTTTGVIHFDPWSADGGQQSRSGQIYNKAVEDVTGPKFYGGITVLGVTTKGPAAFRRDTMALAPQGAGLLGGGIKDYTELAHPWHVAGPGARSLTQVMANELRVSDTVQGLWPASGRIVLSVQNRITNVQEDREFDYTGLNPDNLGFTGVTYDGTGGYALGDFYAEEAWIRLAPRVKYIAIGSKRQVVANEGDAGETTIGNVGPTAAAPEPGVKMGALVCYRDAATGGFIIGTHAAIVEGDARLTNSRAPSGAAGGVLAGTFPNPGFAVDMATQAELDAEAASRAAADAVLIPKSLVDAKGDLITATADDTPARLAVGADGTVLTADAAQAKGVKWAVPDVTQAELDAEAASRLAGDIGPYRTLNVRTEGWSGGVVAGEYWRNALLAGADLNANAIQIRKADFRKLQLRVLPWTGGSADNTATDFTIHLKKVTSLDSVAQTPTPFSVGPSLGNVVAAKQAKNTVGAWVLTDIDISTISDGLYVVTVVTTATTTANSRSFQSWELLGFPVIV